MFRNDNVATCLKLILVKLVSHSQAAFKLAIGAHLAFDIAFIQEIDS